MKVGLNGTCFNDRPSGARQRFIGIYRELAILMPKSEFVIFEPHDCRMESWFAGIPNIHFRPTPIPSEGRIGKLLHASRFWSRAFSHEKFDVFEGFHLPHPHVSARKTVLTVHDVRSARADSSWVGRMAFHYAFSRALKTTDIVVTVSEAMKREIQAYCSNTPIHVIPNGLDAVSREPPIESALQEFRRKFRLPGDFILAVGHLEQRKNYPNLIRAISHLRASGVKTHLVIVGNDSGEHGRLREIVEQCNLCNQVIILSGLSDLEVRCAYALCNLVVLPSFYEGFGIPILEAMAAARPIVLSDISVFREITESQSAYFAPENPKSIACVIGRVLASQQEQMRLVQYGIGRVQSYSFKKISAQYKRLYETLLKEV